MGIIRAHSVPEKDAEQVRKHKETGIITCTAVASLMHIARSSKVLSGGLPLSRVRIVGENVGSDRCSAPVKSDHPTRKRERH